MRQNQDVLGFFFFSLGGGAAQAPFFFLCGDWVPPCRPRKKKLKEKNTKKKTFRISCPHGHLFLVKHTWRQMKTGTCHMVCLHAEQDSKRA